MAKTFAVINAARNPTPANTPNGGRGTLLNRLHNNRIANAIPTTDHVFNNFWLQYVHRQQARDQATSNSYAYGMVRSKTIDRIGLGPRMILKTGDPKKDKEASREWRYWAKKSGFNRMLAVASNAYSIDGGVFFLIVNNEKLNTEVKLQVICVEEDQIRPYHDQRTEDGWCNGIKYDAYGNEVAYSYFERKGETLASSPRIIKAENMIHWWHQFMPGQLRPFSDFTPSNEMFRNMSRYSRAVVKTSEMAANIAAIIKTTHPTIEVNHMKVDDCWREFGLPEDAMMALPDGYDVSQIKAEQPTGTFSDAQRTFLREAARALLVPDNSASGDSSNYNYSSGRLDRQVYWRPIDVDRSTFEDSVLDTIGYKFLTELSLVREEDIESLPEYELTWGWDGPVHTDPEKDANADLLLLGTGQTTMAELAAYQNSDWEERLDQLALEFNVTREDIQAALFSQIFTKAAEIKQAEDQAAQQAEQAKAQMAQDAKLAGGKPAAGKPGQKGGFGGPKAKATSAKAPTKAAPTKGWVYPRGGFRSKNSPL